MDGYAVREGRWLIRQDGGTMLMSLYLDDVLVDEWEGEKIYSFEELHEMLMIRSYEKLRSERENGIHQ